MEYISKIIPKILLWSINSVSISYIRQSW